MLSANDAVALCVLLEQHGVFFWVMGGWGVDALLETESRPHKDLDLLVSLGTLPTFQALCAEQGFTQKWLWEENRWVEHGGERYPTAFVLADAQGRELDVHVIDLAPDEGVVQLYDPPWPFPATVAGITAQGYIAGIPVPCVSLTAQIAMHTGYALPETHRHDLECLRAASKPA